MGIIPDKGIQVFKANFSTCIVDTMKNWEQAYVEHIKHKLALIHNHKLFMYLFTL